MSDAPKKISTEFLLANYEVILLDAFGVLMDSDSALPGAVDFINLLNHIKKPYYILSNGSLYTAEQNEVNYGRRGLKIPKERIISSASMLGKWVSKHQFQNKRFLVLGPEPTKNLVRNAGGLVTENEDTKPDIIVLGDQTGYDFVSGIEHVITLVLRSIESAQPITVLVTNPDVIFPKSKNTYGITAGSLALLLTRAVELRFPKFNFAIHYLGKPYSALFEEARSRESSGRMVMIGDQIETDIRGARNFGIDSVLIGTGVSKISEMDFDGDILPTYLLENFLDLQTKDLSLFGAKKS